jgi:nitrile hydratase accessory protein
LSPAGTDGSSEHLLRSLDEAGLPAGARPPGFREPWQAQAFTLVVELAGKGLFDWPEWVARFSAEIREKPQLPGEDSESAYYRQWLAALEKIVVERRACAPEEIDQRQAEWRQAYFHTPHGHPVELANARLPRPDPHDHDHDHRQEASAGPVAVSKAVME